MGKRRSIVVRHVCSNWRLEPEVYTFCPGSRDFDEEPASHFSLHIMFIDGAILSLSKPH